LGGRPSEVFNIQVQRTGEGRSFSVRNVIVTQSKGICFTCICSFKRAETSTVDIQQELDISQEYSSVIQGKKPFDHEEAPSQDSVWFYEKYLPENPGHYNPLPGLHLRKVDMQAYNRTRQPLDRRQLIYYTPRGRLPAVSTPSSTKEANLHAIGHLFASDRNSLFIIPRMLDVGDKFTRMASLSHTVIFHVGIDKLAMPDEPRGRHAASPPTRPPPGDDVDAWREPADETKRKWFLQESWTTRSSGGRTLHTSRMWDPDTGLHLATTVQDGLIRYAPGTEVKL
jgi:acyl-CoA thioesterase